MGVTVTEDVASGTQFGPIPPSLTLLHPAIVIGHMTTDVRTDIHAVKVNVLQCCHDSSVLATWVPFVQAARDSGEQNVEVVEKERQLYYVTTHHVTAGHELFVWYSDQYASQLGVPPLTDSRLIPLSDSGLVQCCACHETFRYGYSARAHVRFRCKLSSSNTGAWPGEKVKDTDDEAKNNNNSITSLYTQPAESTVGTTSNMFVASHTLKRRHAVDDSDTATSVSKLHHSGAVLPSTDRTADDGPVASAFRKVATFTGLSHLPVSPSNTLPHLVQSANLTQSLHDLQSLHTVSPFSVLPPPTTALLDAMLTGKLASPASVFAGANTLKAELLIGDKAAMMRTTGDPQITDQLMTSRLRSLLPFYRPANPMVEKMLHTGVPGTANVPFTPLNVSQNWCAKCNVSFRMTSDLVYHMRSHHSREHDPVALATTRKRRDDKLTCEFCGETFRERHHLTRHMTSHAEIRHA